MVATEMLPIFVLAGVSNVLGHGGMVWPPIWQDGYALPLDEVWNNHIEGNPTMKDPATGRWINNAKSWLTDQSYTGGHGEFPNGTSLHDGPHNNFDNCTENPPAGQGHITTSAWWCAKKKYPWAAPGYATELGEGCGIHGGNPFGCPYYGDVTDDRPAGSQCLPPPNGDRGTWTYGSRAIDIDFPQARTTKWARGSIVPVGFVAIYHGGGYNYRLCKMPSTGKKGLTEECFRKNILKFAEDKTYWRDSETSWKWGTAHNPWWRPWKTEKKTDVSVGTYPEGSTWRYQGPIDYLEFKERFYKDYVVVPEDLEPGDYVLSWRWDAATAPQVWVSCANIEIVEDLATQAR